MLNKLSMGFDPLDENINCLLLTFLYDCHHMEEWEQLKTVYDLSVAEYVWNFCLDEFRQYCENFELKVAF